MSPIELSPSLDSAFATKLNSFRSPKVQDAARTNLETPGGELRGEFSRFADRLSPEMVSGWRSLIKTGQHAQPFYHPEWFIAFEGSFAAGFDNHIISITKGGELLAVLPVTRRSSFFGGIPARTISSLSGIHSCRFDLIVAPNTNRDEIAQKVWQTLVNDTSWDVIEALDVPEQASFCGVVECAKRAGFMVGRWATRKSPVLQLPAFGNDPFANCPRSFRSFRKRLNSKLDKLKQRGAVSFKIEDGKCEEDLAKFISLESSGWKGANKSSIASNPQAIGFYSGLCQHFKDRGELRLYSLYLDSKPIAMQLGLLLDGVYYSPKAAYDEALAYFAPGHLLVRRIIEDLAKNGVRTFEFLGPKALWKTIWAPEVIEHANWYIFRPNFTGRILHSLTMRLAPKLRSLRHRIYGDPQAV